jgi:pilus assembly protein CpaF
MQTTEIYRKSIAHFMHPVRGLLEDEDVTEIMINGADDIRAERAGRLHATGLSFPNEAALLAAVRNIAEFNGRTIDEMHLAMDGRLPDGSRVHVITPPTAKNGVHVTIRRFRKSTFNLTSLVEKQSLTQQAAEFLNICVRLHKNIVISGGTGTGKTSMLNALSACIPTDERVVVIEDTSELQLNENGHTVCLEAQQGNGQDAPSISIRELFANSLRMRPDRIIVGEVRRGEALDLIQSMISGHAGALTTVHANTPRDAVIRLETLCLMNDAELPVYVARQQVASAVHIVVQLARMSDGSRRVHSIAECCGLDQANQQGQYVWNDLFQFHATGTDDNGHINGQLVSTGRKPTFAAEVRQLGLQHLVDATSELYAA